jgi:hypothetical protein
MRVQLVRYRALGSFTVGGLLATIEESGLIGENKSRAGAFAEL